MFSDLYVESNKDELLATAERLEVVPAAFGRKMLVSNSRTEVRKKREGMDLVAAKPKDDLELIKLLVDTRYDFVIISNQVKLGKKAIRMSKRHETPLVFPMAELFSLKASDIFRTRRNLLRAQKWNGLFALCSGARKATELRAGPEMGSIGILLGLKQDVARRAVDEVPAMTLERAGKRRQQLAWGIEAI